MRFDKNKSYKFQNSEFVERTPEEQVELERKRAVAPGAKTAPSKVPKSKETFLRITLSQADRLLTLNPPAFVTIYLVLSLEGFEAHGLSFTFPAKMLTDKFGFSRCTQWRAVLQLVKAGLIAVEPAPPKPPKIRVL
jgi:hypothetical protein